MSGGLVSVCVLQSKILHRRLTRRIIEAAGSPIRSAATIVQYSRNRVLIEDRKYLWPVRPKLKVRKSNINMLLINAVVTRPSHYFVHLYQLLTLFTEFQRTHL